MNEDYTIYESNHRKGGAIFNHALRNWFDYISTLWAIDPSKSKVLRFTLGSVHDILNTIPRSLNGLNCNGVIYWYCSLEECQDCIGQGTQEIKIDCGVADLFIFDYFFFNFTHVSVYLFLFLWSCTYLYPTISRKIGFKITNFVNNWVNLLLAMWDAKTGEIR